MSDTEEQKSLVEKEPTTDGQQEASQRFLHPLSGLAILLIDNAFFLGELATMGLSLPVTCLLAFLSTLVGVSLIQKLLAGNEWRPAIGKAVLGGIAAGLPLPIAGTLAGGIIMAVSGIKTGKPPKAK